MWWGLDANVDASRLWARLADVSSLTHAPIVWIEAALVLASALALALGRARAAAELVLLGSLHIAAVLEASVRGTAMSSVEPLLVGLVLAARVVGRAVARARKEDQDWLAHELSCGAVAAAFFMAAMAKLVTSGVGWISPSSQTLLVYEHRESALAVLAPWLLAHPAMVGLGAAGTLMVELSSPAFVVARLRRTWAACACLVFVGLALALGIVELTWMVLPLSLALSPPNHRGSPAER